MSTTLTPAAARRPTCLGVSQHYDAVVWYTGDDIITREPGWVGGNALTPRDGRSASRSATTSTRAAGSCTPVSTRASSTRVPQAQLYDPTAANAQCRRSRRPQILGAASASSDRRRATCKTTCCEYWFGAYLCQRRGGHRRRPGTSSTSSASDTPFTSLQLVFNGADSAQNQDHSELVHRDERHPARRRLPAVRELGLGEVRPAGRAVRPAHGRELRVLADRRRLLQAADADDHRPGGRIRLRSGSGPPTTPSPHGTTCSSRLSHAARKTGRRFRATVHDDEHGRQLPGRLAGAAPVARGVPGAPTARGRQAGTPPRATPRGGTSG